MLMVGLTGGIGSGKSAVAARLAQWGAVVVDADRVAREVVAPGTEGLAEIVTAFSDRVLGPDGALDRAALGSVVFADEAGRRCLEAIVHPRVRARTAELVAAAPPDAVVVNDVPLLVESGLVPTYHLVVVVQTAMSIRLERLARDRGMDLAEARRRIAAQVDDVRRRAAADALLTNDGTRDELRSAVDALWADRLLPYEANLRARRAAPLPLPELAEADPTWPEQYERLAARIYRAVAPADLRIDHIGATAVPDLVAADVIDIQLTVPHLGDADGPLAELLAEAGFPRLPETGRDTPRTPSDPSPERLHGSADPARPARLHVRAAGSPGWRYALLTRDYLRAHPDWRAAHLTWRSERAVEAPAGGMAGAEGSPWFDAERPRIERWAGRTGWRP
ncbi:dephospho-CoA kinase [Salinispora arenicola]|uniref:dephospho-CoA kinase n=1 Tax=Salinispora arenicola TaxID=168697 RepID=UPI0018AD58C3|nr:dephospho-CoA kinase [Salinispora arenicola]